MSAEDPTALVSIRTALRERIAQEIYHRGAPGGFGDFGRAFITPESLSEREAPHYLAIPDTVIALIGAEISRRALHKPLYIGQRVILQGKHRAVVVNRHGIDPDGGTDEMMWACSSIASYGTCILGESSIEPANWRMPWEDNLEGATIASSV